MTLWLRQRPRIEPIREEQWQPEMNQSPDKQEAHDYAERIRERLPRRRQELREGIRLSMYAL